MKIAFYAPMKPPDDPTPSGDRTMAQALVQALKQAGHHVIIAARLKTWDGSGDQAAQEAFITQAASVSTSLITAFETLRPDLWLTYHVHYKAPDLIGPQVTRTLGLPYVIAEGSYNPKQADGPWAAFLDRAVTALTAADRHLVLKERDRPGLDALGIASNKLVSFPPFLDTAPFATIAEPETPSPLRLLTMAMMRPGDKAASYRFLIEALHHLDAMETPRWVWTIAGDGPERAAIETLARERLRQPPQWLGAIPPLEALRQAHLLVWSGLNEGFGMAYLEALAAGRVCVAVDGPGVRTVIDHGETGLLTAEDPRAFAGAIASLLRDPDRRTRLGNTARNHALTHHGLESGAQRLDIILKDLTAGGRS